MTLSKFIYKTLRLCHTNIRSAWDLSITHMRFFGNGVVYSTFRTGGIPYVMVARQGKMKIGKDFSMNNGIDHNPIGCAQPCTFFVDNGCKITIGDNVGISQAALIAMADITVGDNVKIGGGASLYTSDFHSLDPKIRASADDRKHRKSAPIIICDNAFIGAHSIILKGVTIGESAVVGAGSVVTKSIPPREIWAGNPAKFIRKISEINK